MEAVPISHFWIKTWGGWAEERMDALFPPNCFKMQIAHRCWTFDSSSLTCRWVPQVRSKTFARFNADSYGHLKMPFGPRQEQPLIVQMHNVLVRFVCKCSDDNQQWQGSVSRCLVPVSRSEDIFACFLGRGKKMVWAKGWKKLVSHWECMLKQKVRECKKIHEESRLQNTEQSISIHT